jgi:hypothetical protein
MTYGDLKLVIEGMTGLERDALHIHGAIFLYILVMAVFRQGRRSVLPWLLVLAVELANESHDLWTNWDGGVHWAISSAIQDLWNTMLWPTVLLLVGRYTEWFQRHPAAPAAEAEPEQTG